MKSISERIEELRSEKRYWEALASVNDWAGERANALDAKIDELKLELATAS